MSILLKDIIKEVEEKHPLEVQIYCDMDGVLADMEKGFREISGGLNPKEHEAKYGKGSFWKVIGQKDHTTGKPKYPNFWLDLEPMPDAHALWSFIKDNFKNPVPVVLTAGQGASITQQKTQWFHKHFGSPEIKVILAQAGWKKPEHVIQYPPERRVTHVLVDDTKKNIDVWDDTSKHRVAIHHKDAASSINQLKAFLTKQ